MDIVPSDGFFASSMDIVPSDGFFSFQAKARRSVTRRVHAVALKLREARQKTLSTPIQEWPAPTSGNKCSSRQFSPERASHPLPRRASKHSITV
jgi:hypothetical protein